MRKPLIKYSKRKTIAITVNNEGDIIIKAPLHSCVKDIEKFVISNQDWIFKRQKLQQDKRTKLNSLNFDESKINFYKEDSRTKLLKMVRQYEQTLGIKVSSVKLSGAKRRWGSCTAQKGIRLNWRLYFVSDKVLEYVVFHELAHTVHLNHSKSFWKYISIVMPDYKERRKELRGYDYLLLI